MTINTSISQAFVWFVVVLIATGLILGVAVGKSDLLNPNSSAAERAWLEETTRHQGKLNRLVEQQRAAELELTLERQRGELAAELELQEYRAKLQATFLFIRETILTVALVTLLLALGVGGIVALARLSRRWLPTGQQVARQPADVRLSSNGRKAVRETARTNEILFRRLDLLAQPSSQPVDYSGNGRHREPSVPVSN